MLQSRSSTITRTAESAVVVFSNTFATSHDRRRSTSRDVTRTTSAHIGSLPNELLLIIFKFVCMESRVCLMAPPNDFPYETTWATDQNVLSPSLFPYAVASVCSRWRDILSTVPVFWTRIVILIDTNPTLSSAIQSYLTWTHDIPLDVIVMRMPGTFDEDDPDERVRVAAVMKLLGPHVHRCRSLQFDVTYSSSLPSLRQDFYGVACGLEELVLECRVDDGGNESSHTVEHRTFEYPILRTLVIDCRNFMDSCMIDARPFNNVTHLQILHFSPSEGDGERLSLYRVLQTLQKFRELRSLTLSDIEFDFASGSYPDSSFPLLPSTVTFEDLSGEIVAEFFRVTNANPHDTIITSCSACSTDTSGTISSSNLTLEEITAGPDLTKFLGDWHGHILSLQNCPGFNDSVLRMCEVAAPNMSELRISDCPNFSVGALREMLDRRSKLAAYSDNQWDLPPFSPITVLTVEGCGPLISSEDLKWFQGHLSYFYWVTMPWDGDQHASTTPAPPL